MSANDLLQLMERIKAGDEEAFGSLLCFFENEVRMVVRHKLPRKLRGRYDSMDFVQEVYRSIMVDWREQSPCQFESASQLQAYLRATATNKVFEIFRRETKTQKYDISKEEARLLQSHTGDLPNHNYFEPPSHDPSPSQEVQARDLQDQLTRGRPAVHAVILNLRHEGMTFEEIAAKVGLSDRAVRRIIDSMKDKAREATS